MTDDPEPLPPVEEFTDALERMPAWEVDVEPTGEVVPDVTSPAEPVAAAKTEAAKTVDTPPPPLERILEVLLFVGGPPLTLERAAEVVRGLTADDFQNAIDELGKSYRAQNRPYHLQPQGHGYVLALRPRFSGLREKLFGGVREARLSQAAVDVLSLVAYRQPATRQEIDSLRGADSAGILRQLIRHSLVAIHRVEGDKEPRYITTTRFLQLFGLTSLDDLPQTQDLQRI